MFVYNAVMLLSPFLFDDLILSLYNAFMMFMFSTLDMLSNKKNLIAYTVVCNKIMQIQRKYYKQSLVNSAYT